MNQAPTHNARHFRQSQPLHTKHTEKWGLSSFSHVFNKWGLSPFSVDESQTGHFYVAKNRAFSLCLDKYILSLDYNRYLIYKHLFNKKKHKEEDS